MDTTLRRISGRLGFAALAAAATSIALAPAALADGSGGTTGNTSPAGGSGSQVVGYTVKAQGIGAQFGFNIPNLIPLPDENLLEADTPFSRTIVASGPQVDAIGTPYYPGDILGNFGGLASEFFPPQFPNPGNWPLMARAEYPKNPAYPTDANFGGTAPAGSPIAPAVFAGAAHASETGGSSSGTFTDLLVGPGMGSNGAPALDVASIQSSNSVNIATSTVSATASSVLKTIEIAGMIDITQITSDASSTSDGSTGTPKAALHLGQVTVDGQAAYIDDKGVHVVGSSASPPGVPTPSDVQKSLDTTLAQDGISVRLLDPQQTTNGGEGIADSGGLVVSISHAFNAPFVNTGSLTGGAVQPCVPTQSIIPGQTVLGNVCLPAGTYTAVTSVTLGMAQTDVNASAIAPLDTSGVSTDLGGTAGDLGAGGTSLPLLSGGDTTTGALTGPGTAPASGGGFGPRLLHFPIRGIPAPVGWVVVGALLCVLFAYPMMLAARWQFLLGRR